MATWQTSVGWASGRDRPVTLRDSSWSSGRRSRSPDSAWWRAAKPSVSVTAGASSNTWPCLKSSNQGPLTGTGGVIRSMLTKRIAGPRPPLVGPQRLTQVLAEELQGSDPGLAGGVLDVGVGSGVVEEGPPGAGVHEHLHRDPGLPDGPLQRRYHLRRAERGVLAEVALDGGRQARPVGLLHPGGGHAVEG